MPGVYALVVVKAYSVANNSTGLRYGFKSLLVGTLLFKTFRMPFRYLNYVKRFGNLATLTPYDANHHLTSHLKFVN